MDTNKERRQILCDIVDAIDYKLDQFKSFAEAIEAIPTLPPHFILIEAGLLADNHLSRILDLCPETHVVAVVERGSEEEYFGMLSKGLFDVIPWPLVNSAQLIAALDRGAERDFFQYQNEQLKETIFSLEEKLREALASPELQSIATNVDNVIEADELTHPSQENLYNEKRELNSSGESDKWLEDLKLTTEQIEKTETPAEAVQAFLNRVEAWFDCPVLFFKYLPSRRSLFLAQAVGVNLDIIRNLGIDFVKEDKGVLSKQLKDPQALASFHELMGSVFGSLSFTAYSLYDREKVRGVVAIVKSDFAGKEAYLQILIKTLRSQYYQLTLRGQLHALETFDLVTQVWNRENFDSKLKEEIARARRTHLPVSLVRISIDQFSEIKKKMEAEKVDLLLRSIAGIVKNNSRINDVVGRLAEDELGLQLPHTGSVGAAIKAERLRRMIESADFSKVLEETLRVTVSMGVSEYPSFCHDPEELYQTADEALFQVKNIGFNRVCMAAQPMGFVADFEVSSQ